MDFHIHFPNRFKDLAKAFFEAYEFDTIGICLDEERNDLKDEKDRQCRFCGKSYPNTSFKKRAHIIPEHLGNRCYISDFECDSCNARYGPLDNQLANYIGISRTLFGTRGKKGIPTLQSHDAFIQAKQEKFFGASKAIQFGSMKNKPVFQYDEKKQEHVLEYKKQPYIPLDVYKSLLKMGLCLIEDDEVPKYQLGFEFLRYKKIPKDLTGSIFSIIKHSVPFRYNETAVWLFKRKDQTLLLPPYTLVLAFGFFVYQIFIPFEISYIKAMKNQEVDVPIFPPYYEGEIPLPFNNYSFDIENVLSTEPRFTSEKIHLQIAHGNPNDKAVLDLKTGLPKPDAEWNPHSITNIILVHDSDFSIKLNYNGDL